MAITDILKSEATSFRPGPSCAVCMALETLPPDEAGALRTLLANPAWRYTELSDRLAADPDNPLDINDQTLSRHAKGRCAARERLR